MADLKTGTTIAGSLIWSKANLDLIPTGDQLFFKQSLIYSENDKPSKADVGLPAVENFGVSSQAESVAGVVNDKYLTPLRNQQHFEGKTSTLTRTILGRTSASNIRGDLELGSIATEAASNYTPVARTLTAGNGLSGGGNLTTNRSFILGTPSTIGSGSGNTVGASTHSHAISLNAADIPSIDVAKITSGVFAYSRLPFSSTQVSNWDTAFSWGNHASVGYATGENFNSSGTYSGLRAQATTKADVGLSNVTNVALNWSWGSDDLTHIWGSSGNSSQSYVYNGSDVKKFIGLNNVDNYSRAHYDGRYITVNGDQTRTGLTKLSDSTYLNQLEIHRTINGWAGIKFSNSGGQLGSLNINIDSEFVFRSGTSNTNRFVVAADGSVTGNGFNTSGSTWIDGTASGPHGASNNIRFGSAQALSIPGAAGQYDVGFMVTTGATNRRFHLKSTNGSINFRTDSITTTGNITSSGLINGTTVRGSDPILKDVQEEVYLTLEEINSLQSVLFKWKYGNQKGDISYGILADEVEKIAPFLISWNEEDESEGIPRHRSVDYDGLSVLIGVSLAKYLKEQKV